MKAQFKKCGYCEARFTEFGDVEHYRPKSEVQKLVAEGGELDHLRNVRGRRNPAITELGYWWLAYEWDNYLLSCGLCNRSYKSALFPVGVPRLPRIHPQFSANNPKKADVAKEKPLLINPFEKKTNPFDHFEYTKIGLIKARDNSERGIATIRICGLHRISLVEQRIEKVMRVEELCNDFAQGGSGTDEQKRAAVGLFIEGHKTSAFSGMARILFRDLTGLTWEELEILVEIEGWMGLVEVKLDRLRLVWDVE